MRSALIAAAFAANAFAVPYVKRDLVTDTDIEVVYATEIITVTAAAPSTDSVSPETADASSSSLSFRHHRYHSTSISSSTSIVPRSTSFAGHSTSIAPTRTSMSTSTAPVPTSTSTSVAPAPVSTKTTSTSVAPAPVSTKTTSTSVAPAPVSTKASTSTSVAAATTSAAASAVPSTYAQIAVYHHNIHRANHSAPDVIWDAGVASTAASIAANCVYAHNVTAGGGGYGQNIAAGVKPNNISAVITELFYNGEVGWYNGLYGQAQPDMTNFEHWGHFSQIVWKDTTKIGCATQDCTSSGLANVGSNVAPFFTVCNYVNPGKRLWSEIRQALPLANLPHRQLRQRVRRQCWFTAELPYCPLEHRALIGSQHNFWDFRVTAHTIHELCLGSCWHVSITMTAGKQSLRMKCIGRSFENWIFSTHSRSVSSLPLSASRPVSLLLQAWHLPVNMEEELRRSAGRIS